MEINSMTSSFRPRNSPSSERFLTLFSPPENPNTNNGAIGDELEEDDVFWTGNFSESDRSDHRSDSPSVSDQIHHNGSTFRRVDSSGILAALPGDTPNKKHTPENRLLCRKISLPSSSSSSSSSRMIPAIPKSQNLYDRDYFSSVPAANFRHSAPVNVPVRPKVEGKEAFVAEGSDDDGDSDKEMLPPHEIVARGSSGAEMTFSVLEGVGRTLKGRDLRQVRNAVWRHTGFLD